MCGLFLVCFAISNETLISFIGNTFINNKTYLKFMFFYLCEIDHVIVLFLFVVVSAYSGAIS